MQWLIVSFVGMSLTSFLLVAQTLSCVAEHIKDEATMEMKPILFPITGSHGWTGF